MRFCTCGPWTHRHPSHPPPGAEHDGDRGGAGGGPRGAAGVAAVHGCRSTSSEATARAAASGTLTAPYRHTLV